jgi:hypothetical protein
VGGRKKGSRHKLMGLSQTNSVRTLVLVGVLAALSCSLVLYSSGGGQLHHNIRRGFQSLWSSREPDHRHEPPWRETLENSVRTLYFVTMVLSRIKNQHGWVKSVVLSVYCTSRASPEERCLMSVTRRALEIYFGVSRLV